MKEPGTPDIRALIAEMSEHRNPEIEVPDPPLRPLLLTIRADIVGAQPPTWRRVELRGDLTLDVVHQHLQAAFGWLDAHLHHFESPGAKRWRRPYFITDFDLDEGDAGTREAEVRLDQVLRKRGEKLYYTYDFGDDWEHLLRVEEVRPATDEDPPGRCTAGAGACPPEDVGGIHMWNDIAAALRADPDPTHLSGDLQMYAEWLPADCDPDDFRISDANVSMSLVGVGADEIIHRFDAVDPGFPLPEPGPELAELLGRCRPTLVDQLGAIAARAMSLSEEATDEDLDLTLRPWQAVLDAIGTDGVRLTAAGWMPPATVQQIWHTSGVAWGIGKGNREDLTPEVAMLREEFVRAGLVRKYKGRLQLTKVGQRCRASRTELQQAVARSLVSAKHDVEQDIRVITLLFIAARWQIGPNSRWAAHAARGEVLRAFEQLQAFEDDVAHFLGEIGWQLSDGSPIHRDDVSRACGDIARLLVAGQGGRFEVPDSPAIRQLARMALFR